MTISKAKPRKPKVDTKSREETPSEFTTICAKICKLHDEATTADLDKQYQIAVLVLEVQDSKDNTYGSRAMEKLAQKLALSVEWLRRTAGAAKVWKDKQALERFANRKMECGRTVSWSHLVQLASITNEVKRKELFDRVCDENLPLDALKKTMNEPKTAPGSAADAIPKNAKSGIRKVIAISEAAVSEMERVEAVVLGPLRNTSRKLVDDDFKKAIESAHAVLAQAESRYGEVRAKLATIYHELTDSEMPPLPAQETKNPPENAKPKKPR